MGTFELLNSAESVEPNGGDSFDDVIFDHIRDGVAIDMADPHAWTTLIRLRQLCTQAKELLSTSTETAVREIPVTRLEFEDLIRPSVEAGVEELLRTIRSAPVPADDLAAVVLTGGSSRIPLVSELLTAQLRNRAVLAAEPELACARGAAIAAQRLVPVPQAALVPAIDSSDSDDPPAPDRPSIAITPLDLPKPRSFMRMITGMKPSVLGAAGAAVVAVGVALTFYLRPADPPAPQAPGTSAVANTGSSPSTPAPKTGKDGH
jgi:molecular chaperone DnaK